MGRQHRRNGWDFGFTGYPDNVPASPRILAPAFDFWVVQTTAGPLGYVTLTRRRACLTGGIFGSCP
jgi:hypothetical protein